MQYNAQGIVYISFEWVFTLVQILIVTLRIYSRTFLTRSVGSDDFFIVIAFVLNVAATVSDLEAFRNGWSQHESDLSPAQYAAEEKWEYIGYIQAYIVYFFIRASVMLFVLRLLPSYKKWQQRLVYLAFLVNFLVTAYTCITFGISCIPFKANWDTVPNAKCFSDNLVVLTNQINGALACVCDIATALIPQCLLWNVQMRAKTKRQLNFIFGLGLITSALSIARATTITQNTLYNDSTWNMVPAYYVSMFECNLGILLACGPAIRQFWAYRTRTHSSLPTKHRQRPNEDFEKMRYRVNIRDIFWYRKAQMVGNTVFDASPIFRSKSPPPESSSNDPQESSQVTSSALDWWEKRIKKVFSTGHEHKTARDPSSKTTNLTPGEFSEKEESPKALRSGNLSSKKPHTGRKWGLFSPKSEPSTGSSKQGLFSPQSKVSTGSSNQPTFLLSATEAGTPMTTARHDENESFWPIPSHECETADELSNPRMEPIHGSQIV